MYLTAFRIVVTMLVLRSRVDQGYGINTMFEANSFERDDICWHALVQQKQHPTKTRYVISFQSVLTSPMKILPCSTVSKPMPE